MTVDDIKLLAEILTAYGLSKLEYRSGERSILLEKATRLQLAPAAVPQMCCLPAKAEPTRLQQHNEVRSPIVGFLQGTAPAPSLVKVGSRVKRRRALYSRGDEADERVVAEVTARLYVCVKNGEIVEYGRCSLRCSEGCVG